MRAVRSRLQGRAITASRLREDIYRVFDEILETGVPVEVHRKGKVLRISPSSPRTKLERLIPRPGFLKVDLQELVHIDWSTEWTGRDLP